MHENFEQPQPPQETPLPISKNSSEKAIRAEIDRLTEQNKKAYTEKQRLEQKVGISLKAFLDTLEAIDEFPKGQYARQIQEYEEYAQLYRKTETNHQIWGKNISDEEIEQKMNELIFEESCLVSYGQIIQSGESEKILNHFAEKFEHITSGELSERLENGDSWKAIIHSCVEQNNSAIEDLQKTMGEIAKKSDELSELLKDKENKE